MITHLARILPVFVYPVGLSGGCAIAAAVFAVLKKRKPAVALGLCSAAILWLFSLPIVSWGLTRNLESKFDPNPVLPKVGAIVLLGGCTKPAMPPRTTVEISFAGDRILHAARLLKQGYAPIIIATGGKLSFVYDFPGSEARCMATILENDCGVDSSAIVLETKAENTHDHAPNVAKILQARGIAKDVILVTSAAHMYRSVKIFQKYGYIVHPSPADFEADEHIQWNLSAFLPCADALFQTTSALHEYYGLLAYKLLGWI